MPTDRRPLALATIVAVGRELIREGGIDNLSLRRLAGRLDVSAPALYAHVVDKDHLVRAIAEGEGELLVARFDAVDAIDAGDRLRRLSAAHVAHAVDEPALYAVLGRFPPDFDPGPSSGSGLRSATRAFSVLRAAAAAAGCADPLVAALALWAGARGVAAVVAADTELPDRLRARVATAVIEHLVAGLTGVRAVVSP